MKKKENKEQGQNVPEKDKQNKKEDKWKAELNSEKLKKRERIIRIIKISLLIIALFLIIIYFLLRLFYDGGAFTVALDDALAKKSGLIMYEKLSEKDERKILKVDQLEFVDNISINWLPADIDSQGEGTHNGPNYIAYTFYLENKGADAINYWYKIVVDDVVKNVDEAIRVMVYRNGEREVFAKKNSRTGEAETGTIAFKDDITVTDQQRTGFNPGDIDRFTVVIWVEGDDPDCVDALIGGMMKMHMDITEEHTY